MSKLKRFFKIGFFGQNSNRIISATSDWILMIYGSLDSSHHDASSCSVFMSIGLVDKMLFVKVQNQLNADSNLCIDPRGIKTLRLDAP